MVCHTFDVLSRSCSLPAGNSEFAVQEQWPSDTSGSTFEYVCVIPLVTVTRNLTYRPPGTSPVGVPRIVTCPASSPWVDVVVADEVGVGAATGAGVAAGVSAGVAAGVEEAEVGDGLEVAVEAAGAGLALGVACDEQPVTAPRAAAAKAAGTATRPRMAGIRGMRGARRAWRGGGVHVLLRSGHCCDTDRSHGGQPRQQLLPRIPGGFPEPRCQRRPEVLGRCGRTALRDQGKAWWRGSHDRDRP